MKHDAWMDDLFLGRNSNLSRAHMLSVLCDLCSDCTCENVACGRCICLHFLASNDSHSILTRPFLCLLDCWWLSAHPVDCQGIHFPASEKASLN